NIYYIMPNIFQLTTPDLIAILRILKPDIFIDGKISNVNGNNENSFDTLVANNFSTYEDCKKLRSQITEWLLLNGYSTMHQFYKDPTTDTWIMPNDKSRLVECGKYRVSQKVPIIIPDLLFDETPYLFNPIDDSIDSGFNSARVFSNSINDNNNNNLIKTKSATDRVLMQSFAPLSALDNHYNISKGFSYQLSLKEMIENCVAKIKVSATLDNDYNILMSNSLNEGRIDIVITLLQNKAIKFCTNFEGKMLNDFLKNMSPTVEVMDKYFKESSITGVKNNVLNVLGNVLDKNDYKEFENNLYKVRKLYSGAKLDDYYKNFYGKNHKIIDSLIYDSISKEKILKFMKELEDKLINDPRQEELRQFIINLYSIKHKDFKNTDISEKNIPIEEVEETKSNQYNTKNNEIHKNIDTIKISNSLKLE
uniref:ERAP1-like C-terminal domain-containing protein n=2 Tax=Strongyloides stercoralis TaxID=6248 RepID=A0AAF5DHY1_STRER